MLPSVKSAGPIQVSAANAAQLGGRGLNTQAIAVWKSTGSGSYSLVLIVHRFAAVCRSERTRTDLYGGERSESLR